MYDLSLGAPGFEDQEELLCSVLDSYVHCPLDVALQKVKRLQLRIQNKDACITKLEQERNVEKELAKVRVTLLEKERDLAKARVAQLEKEKELEKGHTGQSAKERELEKAHADYRTWQKDCDAYFAMQNKSTFISFPKPAQPCRDQGCVSRRKDTKNLATCKHEVASLYKGSGKNLVALLKAERVRWHPDKFGRGCAVEKRSELQSKASQMFVILQEILADENKVQGNNKENMRP